MLHLSDVLLLGDSRLYMRCAPVEPHERSELEPIIEGMANIVQEFRARYHAGRAIAAPQVGVMKRLVVMHIDRIIPLFNPELFDCSEEMIEMWDDCMSFPNLHVRLRRHRFCKLRYRDMNWQEQIWDLPEDLSELLQHEVDHLDGVLATMRAIDGQSFRLVQAP